MSKYGNAFEQNELTIGADYLPSEVSNLVNKNVCNGGGGGPSTTSTTMDADTKRRILPILDDVNKIYRSGDLGRVANTEQSQAVAQQGLAQAQELAAKGLGAENMLNALNNTKGEILSGQQGALGSARADRAREAALLDKSMQLEQADAQVRSQATADAQRYADHSRGLDQETLDANAKGAERIMSFYTAAPTGQTTQQTGGGK